MTEKYLLYAHITYFCVSPLTVPSCHGRLACPARHMPMDKTENPRIRLISAPLSLKIGTIDTWSPSQVFKILNEDEPLLSNTLLYYYNERN